MAKIRYKKKVDGKRQTSRGTRTEKHLVGVVWYEDEEQWRAMRELASDPERLEYSYDAWLRMMHKSLRKLSEALFPVTVPVDVAEYRRWCDAKSLPYDASSRAQYVTNLGQRGNESPDST